MSVEISDFIDKEDLSNCCGSFVYVMGDSYMCDECKEWCDIQHYCPKCGNEVLGDTDGLCGDCV